MAEKEAGALERYNVIVLGAGSGSLTVAAGAATLGARGTARAAPDGRRLPALWLRAVKGSPEGRSCRPHGGAYGLHATAAPPQHDLRTVMDYVRAARARIAPHDSVERFTALGVDV